MKLKDAILLASLALNAYHFGKTIFNDARNIYGMLSFIGIEEVKEEVENKRDGWDLQI